MADPDVTIIVSPRERFSFAEASLESVYTHTPEPFELIYVDVNSPARVRRYLEQRAREKGFQLFSVPYYLTPNEARNEGLKRATTKYVVFIDNDILVSPEWLSALVGCAEETGAWVVGPLYLDSDGRNRSIHGTGRSAAIRQSNGRTFVDEKNPFKGAPLTAFSTPLRREECDLVEFHCMLVRTEVFNRLGPLDEKLLNHREHHDLCLEVRKAGGSIVFEPSATVTYFPPQRLALSDIAYFMIRWSEAWTEETLPYFHKKWGLDYDEAAAKDLQAGWRRHRFRLLPTRLRRWMHTICGGRIADRAERHVLLPLEMSINRAVVPYISRRYRSERINSTAKPNG